MKIQHCESRIKEAAGASLQRVVVRTERGSVSINDILSNLSLSGVSCYIAGGAVRDWIQGCSAHDIDVSINRDIEHVMPLLSNTFSIHEGHILDRIQSFGAIKIGTSNEADLDINILRDVPEDNHGYMYDYVFKASQCIRRDAQLRDFSFNALYWDFREGTLHDPTCVGIEDLENKTIRMITHPNILKTNYKQTLRIVKFINRGFHCDATSREYLANNLDSDVVQLGSERCAGWLQSQIIEKGEHVERFLKEAISITKTKDARAVLESARQKLVERLSV